MAGAGRRVAVFLAVVATLVLASGSASASTGTGSDNPVLTATLTVTNTGGGADGNTETATAGESVTATASVRNNSTQTRTIVGRITAQDPDGASITEAVQVSIDPGQTLTVSDSIPVEGDTFVLGSYEVTLSAQPLGDTSSDTTTFAEDATFPSVAISTIQLV